MTARRALSIAASGVIASPPVAGLIVLLAPDDQPAGPCVRPEAHGAVVDDGLDDRVAIQAALDLGRGGCVQLSTGGAGAARTIGEHQAVQLRVTP